VESGETRAEMTRKVTTESLFTAQRWQCFGEGLDHMYVMRMGIQMVEVQKNLKMGNISIVYDTHHAGLEHTRNTVPLRHHLTLL
jgi:hypothetical protein